MPEAQTILSVLLWVVGVYLLAGLAFAVAFAWRGAPRIDPGARGTPLSFKLLIIPGCAALWPLLLTRWLRAGKRPSAHAELQ